MTDINPSTAAASKEPNPRKNGFLASAFRIVATIVLLAGISTFFARSSWIADLAANLRIQLILAGLAVTLLAAATKRYIWIVVQLLMICVHLPWLIDVPPRAEWNTAAPPSFTVSAANVYINNRNHDAISNVLTKKDADVIAVFEVNPTLFDRLKSDLQDSHPHVEGRPQPHAFGVAMFSRHPLNDIITKELDVAGGSILATADINGHPCRIAAVHPVSPMTPRRFTGRNQHLANVMRQITAWQEDHPNSAVVMIGDFNLTPWSPHFVDLLSLTGLRHVAEGSGMEPSWFALPAFPFGLVLDHCLVSRNLRLNSFHYGPTVHSDHRVLTVELSTE